MPEKLRTCRLGVRASLPGLARPIFGATIFAITITTYYILVGAFLDNEVCSVLLRCTWLQKGTLFFKDLVPLKAHLLFVLSWIILFLLLISCVGRRKQQEWFLRAFFYSYVVVICADLLLLGHRILSLSNFPTLGD